MSNWILQKHGGLNNGQIESAPNREQAIGFLTARVRTLMLFGKQVAIAPCGDDMLGLRVSVRQGNTDEEYWLMEKERTEDSSNGN